MVGPAAVLDLCRHLCCAPPLGIMAAVPKQLGTPEDTFTALALQFNFDQRFKDKIIELGIRAFAEFRHYARNEDEVKRLFIDTVKDTSYEEMQGRLQSARLRFAWTACKALLDSEHAAATGAAEGGLLSAVPPTSRAPAISLGPPLVQAQSSVDSQPV